MEIDMKQFLEVPADVKVALFGGVRITQTTTTTTDITTAVGGLRYVEDRRKRLAMMKQAAQNELLSQQSRQTSAQTALQRHSDDGGGSADALRLHSAHIEWFDQWLSRCQPNTVLDIGEFEKQLSAMLLNVPSTALESILVQNDAAIASVQPFEASTVVPAILSICSASAIASDAATVFAHRIVYPSLVALSEPPSRALVDAVSEFARNKPRAALNGLLVPITDECCGKASNQALDLVGRVVSLKHLTDVQLLDLIQSMSKAIIASAESGGQACLAITGTSLVAVLMSLLETISPTSWPSSSDPTNSSAVPTFINALSVLSPHCLSSIPFANLLKVFINRHGKSALSDHPQSKEQLTAVVSSLTSFSKRTLLSSLKKL